METTFHNEDSLFGDLDEPTGPATDTSGESAATTDLEAVSQIKFETSANAIHISIESIDRPIEIKFADGTKISHADGSKVIVITRGPQYRVVGHYLKRRS